MVLYLVQPLWSQSMLAQDILREVMIRECRKNFADPISFSPIRASLPLPFPIRRSTISAGVSSTWPSPMRLSFVTAGRTTGIA